MLCRQVADLVELSDFHVRAEDCRASFEHQEYLAVHHPLKM